MPRSARVVLGAVVGLAIFVGLPLLAWGPGDVRGFLADPVRQAFLLVATATTLVAAAIVPPAATARGDEAKRVRRQHVAVVLLQVLSLAVFVAAPWDDRRGVVALPGVVRALGLALFCAGHAMMTWSQAVLGRQFSTEVTIQPGHRLVTAGPYRRLRHPRYLGIAAFMLGTALLFRSGLGLALAAAVVAVLLWRIPDEERLMQREFGAEWDAYAARTWRLLPYVF
jgi:protein-S-isoprenylcysteine O-methyltransferase Ste14